MSKRLTERDEYGNAFIIGVDSQDLLQNLYGDEYDRVVDALNKLADYEEAQSETLTLTGTWQKSLAENEFQNDDEDYWRYINEH